MTKRIVIALVLLMAMPAVLLAQQPQSKPWAALSDGVLRFTYGAKPTPPSQVTCTGCGKKVAWSTNYCSNCGAKNPKDFTVYNALDTTHFKDWRGGVKRPWYDQGEKIKKVVFESSFKQATNIYSTEGWFYGMENLETIVGIENLNTSNVTSMKRMFNDCYKLTSLDVTRFNTAKVTDMSYMFEGCRELSSLDVTRFNTSKVTDMSFMFSECSSLTSLNVTHFNTENVSNMRFMFDACSNLTSLDLSHLNTTNVKDMERMFAHCENLAKLDLSHFNTTNVKDMSRMFLNCAKLSSLDLSNFNTANVEYMESMFDDCRSLVSLDLLHFNTSKVKKMSNMFRMCEKMTTLDISSFDTRAVKQGEMRGLFFGSGLKTIYVSATTWTPQRFGYQGSWQNTMWDSTANFECNAQIIKK